LAIIRTCSSGKVESLFLDRNFWEYEDLVQPEESVELESPFSEKEIREAVFSCYAEGGPDPNGLSFLLYHKFWDTVKGDIMNMFLDFYEGCLDLIFSC
jgi:hypothetical protein